MLNRPMPKTFSETDAEISMMKWNGENWNSASNARCPSTRATLDVEHDLGVRAELHACST